MAPHIPAWTSKGHAALRASRAEAAERRRLVMAMLADAGVTASEIDHARRAGMHARGVEGAMRGQGIQVEREQRRRMDAITLGLMQRGWHQSIAARAYLALMSTRSDTWDDILFAIAEEEKQP